MTTRVEIDAHAGWPVLVTMLVGEPGTRKEVRTQIVQPNTNANIYIHSGCVITHIEEMNKS